MWSTTVQFPTEGPRPTQILVARAVVNKFYTDQEHAASNPIGSNIRATRLRIFLSLSVLLVTR